MDFDAASTISTSALPLLHLLLFPFPLLLPPNCSYSISSYPTHVCGSGSPAGYDIGIFTDDIRFDEQTSESAKRELIVYELLLLKSDSIGNYYGRLILTDPFAC